MPYSTELVMHVNDELNIAARRQIEANILGKEGVTAAHFNDNRPHLMVIKYDPRQIDSFEIMHEVKQGKVHAERIS